MKDRFVLWAMDKTLDVFEWLDRHQAPHHTRPGWEGFPKLPNSMRNRLHLLACSIEDSTFWLTEGDEGKWCFMEVETGMTTVGLTREEAVGHYFNRRFFNGKFFDGVTHREPTVDESVKVNWSKRKPWTVEVHVWGQPTIEVELTEQVPRLLDRMGKLVEEAEDGVWPGPGEGQHSTCPYCGAVTRDTPSEIQHMEKAHPEIIVQRLLKAGMHPEALEQAQRLGVEITPGSGVLTNDAFERLADEAQKGHPGA